MQIVCAVSFYENSDGMDQYRQPMSDSWINLIPHLNMGDLPLEPAAYAEDGYGTKELMDVWNDTVGSASAPEVIFWLAPFPSASL